LSATSDPFEVATWPFVREKVASEIGSPEPGEEAEVRRA